MSSGIRIHEHNHEMEALSWLLSIAGQVDEASAPGAASTLLSEIVAANERLRNRLSAAELALQAQAKEAAAYLCEARTDPLTRLPNRRAFDDELARCLGAWRRYGLGFSVLLIDVDHFKRLNDRFGHLAGDAVLADLAGALRGVLRECDMATRYGGEEFAALLPQTDADGAKVAAEHIRQAIEETRFSFESTVLPTTVSCGAAHVLLGDDAVSIVKRADEALYAAKRGGRNRVCSHTGDRIVGFVASEPKTTSADASKPIRLSDLDRACDELRRRLLEVTGQTSGQRVEGCPVG